MSEERASSLQDVNGVLPEDECGRVVVQLGVHADEPGSYRVMRLPLEQELCDLVGKVIVPSAPTPYVGHSCWQDTESSLQEYLPMTADGEPRGRVRGAAATTDPLTGALTRDGAGSEVCRGPPPCIRGRPPPGRPRSLQEHQ